MRAAAAQETILRKAHAQRRERLHARDHVAAVAAPGLRQPLLDERRDDGAAVGLVNDFARAALSDRKLVLRTGRVRAQLVNVRILHVLVLAHERTDVGEQHFAPGIDARMEHRPAIDERRARKRGSPVVERRR